MSEVTKIHKSRQPKRPHFIGEWMEKRGIIAAELAAELDVDKSVVSRWLSGSTPGESSQEKLAAYFGCEPEALFRDPDEDWIVRMFRNRSQEEKNRIRAIVEAAFPPTTKIAG